MSEVWKPIKGYEGIYEVSSYGRVRSLTRSISLRNRHGEYVRVEKGRIMAQKLQNTDRLQVSLRKVVNGKLTRKTCYVHRLVAQAFIPNPDGLETVNHKNEDHHDNRVENLEWMTKADNNKYGTHCERCGKSQRMSVEMLTDDGEHVAYFDSMSEAAEKSGCPLSSIHRCCYGRQKSTNGYQFRFTTEYRKLIKQRNFKNV